MIIQTKQDIIKLKGALTENQWTSIRSSVCLLLEKYPNGVIIEADGLTEISETGARTFLDASKFIQSHNARVVVAGLSDNILSEIRKIPGVRSQLVIASSVEEARASLETSGTTFTSGKDRKPAVLVPLLGAWEKAIELAAPEAAARRTDIHLLYVLQIPRNLPIGVPMPELEQESQLILTNAEKMLKRKGAKTHTYTSRARDVFDGTIKFAAESKPGLVVIAYSKEAAREGNRWSSIGNFCHEISCDVAVYCVSEQATE